MAWDDITVTEDDLIALEQKAQIIATRSNINLSSKIALAKQEVGVELRKAGYSLDNIIESTELTDAIAKTAIMYLMLDEMTGKKNAETITLYETWLNLSNKAIGDLIAVGPVFEGSTTTTSGVSSSKNFIAH